MTIEIFYGVVLFLMSIAVFALAMSIGKVGKKLNRVDSVVTDSLANMARTVSDVVETTTALADRMAELDSKPEDVSEKIEKEIDRAREQVFTDWIKGIVSYDPYKTGGA